MAADPERNLKLPSPEALARLRLILETLEAKEERPIEEDFILLAVRQTLERFDRPQAS